MKISISPRFVIYTDYEGVTTKEALLHALQTAENNMLTLFQIGNIRVNGNRITGSYGQAKMQLTKQGYQIETKMKLVDGVMCSTYRLINKEFSPSDSDNFNQL